jgi:hypothetical protein
LSEPDPSGPDRRASSSDDRDAFYLLHMLECIESSERYSGSRDAELDELAQFSSSSDRRGSAQAPDFGRVIQTNIRGAQD